MGNTIRQKLFPKDKVKKDQCDPILIPKDLTSFEGSNGKKYIFLPAEVVMDVQEFSFLCVKHQSVKFRGKLTVELKSLPQEVKGCIQEKLKIALFQNQIVAPLRKEVVERKDKKDGDGNNYATLTYQINQHVSWTPDLTLLPFDSQRVPICAELLHFKIGKNRYYFNITNEDDKKKREYFLPRGLHKKGLEDFKLYYYESRYEKIEEEIAKKRVKYSPQITVYFYLARLPWNYYLTVLLPNFILQLLSIVLFFTLNDFEERLKNITVLILAIVTFLPTVRAGLPHIPYITLMDFIIYSTVFNVGLCMLQTSIKRQNPNYESKVWLIIACSIVFLTTLVSGVFLFWKIVEWLWVQRKAEQRKRVIENIVVQKVEKISSLHEAQNKAREEQDGKQMPQEIKEMEVVEVGTGSVAEAIIKGDDECSKMKSLVPTEKRYVDREVQVRIETGKGLRFSSF